MNLVPIKWLQDKITKVNLREQIAGANSSAITLAFIQCHLTLNLHRLAQLRVEITEMEFKNLFIGRFVPNRLAFFVLSFLPGKHEMRSNDQKLGKYFSNKFVAVICLFFLVLDSNLFYLFVAS